MRTLLGKQLFEALRDHLDNLRFLEAAATLEAAQDSRYGAESVA